MNLMVYITMFGWIPFVLGLFSKLKPRHAVIVGFLAAWLFLPMASFPIKGLPDYTKMTATCWGILIAAFFFDRGRIFSFKPHAVDIPMAVWCLCPLFSSLSNGLGLYDGLSEALSQTVIWGFPFFIGRLYFNSHESLREYAVGILIGGLIYIPLCLYESRMSPQLHNMVYGWMQRSFVQTIRWGGYRPMVFMEHGLMVGVWMMSASLIGVWLWTSRSIKKIGGIPMIWWIITLLITTLLTRSTGAIGLLIIGIFTLLFSHKMKMGVIIICLLLIPPLYISTRSTGVWTGYNLQLLVANTVNYERAESLWFRMENENILTEKAMQHPAFGWGGWGRSRVYDEDGKDLSVTDGLWVIVLGQRGLVGLSALTISILLPVYGFLRRYPPAKWSHPKIAASAALSILLALYMIDNLLNAMTNPIFTVAAGGMTGLMASGKRTKSASNNQPKHYVEVTEHMPRFI